MSDKHTAGPWEFDGFEMVIATGLIAPFRIAHKDGADVITGTRTWEANARLIAAAPDLLEAAIDLTAITKAFNVDGEVDMATLNRARRKLEAAIAKATNPTS